MTVQANPATPAPAPLPPSPFATRDPATGRPVRPSKRRHAPDRMSVEAIFYKLGSAPAKGA